MDVGFVSFHVFMLQLNDVTGITDADELSKLFLESERRIFSVFRDINAVTEDIDALQQEVPCIFIFTMLLFISTTLLTLYWFAMKVTALEAAQAKHNPNRQQNLMHRRAVLKTKQTLLRADEYENRYDATRTELATS